MFDDVIIIAGRIGSGKTTVSKAVSEYFGMHYKNVGDELAFQLDRSPTDRTTIGSTFLARFGFEAYRKLALALAAPGTVVDGLRSAEVVDELRISANSMTRRQCFVVFCQAGPASSFDEFGDWTDQIGRRANFSLAWNHSVNGAQAKATAAILAIKNALGGQTGAVLLNAAELKTRMD